MRRLGDGGGQGKTRKVRQSLPGDVEDRLKTGEREGRHQGQVEQVHGFADRTQGCTTQADQIARVVADQIPGNLLRSVKTDGIGSVGADEDISVDGLAGCILRGISLGVDGCGGLRAEGSRLGLKEIDVSQCC